jgi:hypothetical protein
VLSLQHKTGQDIMTKYEDMTMAQLRAVCAERGVTPARSKADTLARLDAADVASANTAEVQDPRPAPRGPLHRMLMAYPSYGALCCQLPEVRAVMLPRPIGMAAIQRTPYYPEDGKPVLRSLRIYDGRDRAAPPQGVEFFP